MVDLWPSKMYTGAGRLLSIARSCIFFTCKLDTTNLTKNPLGCIPYNNYVTGFAKKGLVRTQFQVSLFTTIQQIQP